MNISELYQLTNWIEGHNENAIIQHDYERLIEAIQDNYGNSQPFEQQKDSLFATLKSISFEELSNEQIKFLENINITENLGLPAIKRIKDVLYINAIDRETARNKISEMLEEVRGGIDRLNSIKNNLEGLVDEEQYELDNEVLMRVGFMGYKTPTISDNNLNFLISNPLN